MCTMSLTHREHGVVCELDDYISVHIAHGGLVLCVLIAIVLWLIIVIPNTDVPNTAH